MSLIQVILSHLNRIDWQTLADIGSSFALLLAILVFAWEIRANRREREFAIFLRFVDAYEQVSQKRRTQWSKVKDVLQSNPALKHEIGDRTSSLDYLRTRAEQAEPMYAIEHGILEYEIRSLNILNELCRYAEKDPRKIALVNALFASEISYYRNKLDDLLTLREHESEQRLFSIPRCDALVRFSVGGFFDDWPGEA